MNLIQPGQQEVRSGKFSPFCTRFNNSLPSSKIVKSAAKLVSNTLSNPNVLNAETNLPTTFVPNSYPNSSPTATLTAGAI